MTAHVSDEPQVQAGQPNDNGGPFSTAAGTISPEEVIARIQRFVGLDSLRAQVYYLRAELAESEQERARVEDERDEALAEAQFWLDHLSETYEALNAALHAHG